MIHKILVLGLCRTLQAGNLGFCFLLIYSKMTRNILQGEFSQIPDRVREIYEPLIWEKEPPRFPFEEWIRINPEDYAEKDVPWGRFREWNPERRYYSGHIVKYKNNFYCRKNRVCPGKFCFYLT